MLRTKKRRRREGSGLSPAIVVNSRKNCPILSECESPSVILPTNRYSDPLSTYDEPSDVLSSRRRPSADNALPRSYRRGVQPPEKGDDVSDLVFSTEEGSYGNGPHLPKRFFSTDRYPTSGRVNSYSRVQYLLDVLSILDGTPELATLKDSPFSVLFTLLVRQCSMSGKLLHNLLCRQLVTANANEIWFTFGGHPLRFSLLEFHHITGLPCGPYPADQTLSARQAPSSHASPYWETLLGPDTDVTIDGLVTKLKSEPSMPGWQKLRLVLIVIVEGILICGTQPIRPSAPIVEMVKNLDFFFSYPWGRHSFDQTIRMIKVGKKVSRHSNLMHKLKQKSLVLHGFPIALQLMVFQCAPLLMRYLPSGADTHNFYGTSVKVLPRLKTYHTHNILQVENDIKLSVNQTIDRGFEKRSHSLGVDHKGDAHVLHMLELLAAGYRFSKHVWSGGDDSLQKLCLCARQKNFWCKCSHFGAPTDTQSFGNVKQTTSVVIDYSELVALREEVGRLKDSHASTLEAFKTSLVSDLHSFLRQTNCIMCPTDVANSPHL